MDDPYQEGGEGILSDLSGMLVAMTLIGRSPFVNNRSLVVNCTVFVPMRLIVPVIVRMTMGAMAMSIVMGVVVLAILLIQMGMLVNVGI